MCEANFAVCQSPAGEVGREGGAPKLTDSIWLYGGDRASITATVPAPRNGVMPRWNSRLDPVKVKMLADYVYSLGGGETAPAPSPAVAQAGSGGRKSVVQGKSVSVGVGRGGRRISEKKKIGKE